MSIEYKTIEPPNHLKNIVKHYFVMEGESKTYNMFHFADFNTKLLFIKDGLVGHCKSSNIKSHNECDGRVIRTNDDISTSRHTAVLLGPNNDYCLIPQKKYLTLVVIQGFPKSSYNAYSKNTWASLRLTSC